MTHSKPKWVQKLDDEKTAYMLGNIHKNIAHSNPALERGVIRCAKCKRQMTVDPVECLGSGWPKCCNYTMSLVSNIVEDLPDDAQ